MTTIEVDKAIEEVIDGGSAVHDDDYIQRFGEGNEVGDVAPQGDVYMILLDDIPSGYERADTVPAKVTPDDSPDTVGSMHCWESTDGIEMYISRNPTAIEGPIYKLGKTTRLNHPVHKSIEFFGGGRIYKCEYQRQFAEELKRQAD